MGYSIVHELCKEEQFYCFAANIWWYVNQSVGKRETNEGTNDEKHSLALSN